MDREVVQIGGVGPPLLVPPLKWAGGKRWFVARHLDLVPDRFERYIEPFLGSGALFFALRPAAALLSDLNSDLINLYSCIRDCPIELSKLLARHQRLHSAEHYYRVRAQQLRSPLTQAARFLYLNRTCWNGLYRVNRQGKFNVPIGSKTSVVLESDDFSALSSAMKNVDFRTSDFEKAVDAAKSGDFVFIDPPYTVAHNNNGFVNYNESLFSWADQVRLRKAVDRAVSRGAKVLITNAAHQSIYSLYQGYEQLRVSRAGVIAANGAARGSFNEVVIRCY
ncbi:DNA adenine methylase [Stenotrophomonas rhizophila]|uniref:DNA adenine methylase n=1 Tax=Stenotrophomonas rhizophila TaxID=216778 RepID=UPI000F4C268B|nr:Dam family site-specific DNA-(adenine-N6)-methyltransferase [Stenotrophomonas rhizophila]ROP77159.1 DNA adenine methylase [Stenotrophomonas rhizophila]